MKPQIGILHVQKVEQNPFKRTYFPQIGKDLIMRIIQNFQKGEPKKTKKLSRSLNLKAALD